MNESKWMTRRKCVKVGDRFCLVAGRSFGTYEITHTDSRFIRAENVAGFGKHLWLLSGAYDGSSGDRRDDIDWRTLERNGKLVTEWADEEEPADLSYLDWEE